MHLRSGGSRLPGWLPDRAGSLILDPALGARRSVRLQQARQRRTAYALSMPTTLGIRLLLFSVVLFAVAAAVSVSPDASATTAPCAPITVRLGGNDFSYRVRVERGRVGCLTARSVLRSFMLSARAPVGWACFRGHTGSRWAAACSGLRGLRRGVIVRAYLIAG
jgi:hypothetical protein